METPSADQARQSRLLDFFRAGLTLTATGDTRTSPRTLQRASENDIMASKSGRGGVIMKRLSGRGLATLAFAAAVVLLGSALTPARADVVVQIDKSSQRMAVSVDGMMRYNWPVFDRPQRLWHAERCVSAAIDGAALVFAKVLQFADAAR